MEKEEKTRKFPPVVSVLGHVDHGKTTLLDAIRKSNIASKEAGGITQGIGASQIEIDHENKKRKITFIDTPGHEAFSNMRSQGVNAADIALLIIAADDGIMPQTKESITKILESKIPYIVVFTKADLPSANVEKIKQQLPKEGVMLEGLGGDVPCVAVSAKTGDKVYDLLDLILLVYDMSQIAKDEKKDFMGIIIDSKLDRKKGVIASIVIKEGIINLGEKLFIKGKNVGKIRALVGTDGKNVKNAEPGDVVEILGTTEILPTGSALFTREIVNDVLEIKKEPQKMQDIIANFFKDENKNTISVILKTQTSGEIEAIKNSLPSDAKVVVEGQGDIATSDILLAKDLNAIILGFNVDITKEAKSLADNERVFFRVYKIIYELLDEVEDALDLIRRRGEEIIIGKASIVANFEHKDEKILGLRVNEGRLAVGDKIKILRGEKNLGNSIIKSLRRGKNEVKEVAKNLECGATISPSVDFLTGDMLLSYSFRQ